MARTTQEQRQELREWAAGSSADQIGGIALALLEEHALLTELEGVVRESHGSNPPPGTDCQVCQVLARLNPAVRR